VVIVGGGMTGALTALEFAQDLPSCWNGCRRPPSYVASAFRRT
jgi:glycine/D-amino acid oxidase-like deaminating enzyme